MYVLDRALLSGQLHAPAALLRRNSLQYPARFTGRRAGGCREEGSVCSCLPLTCDNSVVHHVV
jgi:hypothetical protein